MKKETRDYVLSRDGYICQQCRILCSPYQLQIAHRIKKGKGTLNHIKKNFVVDNMTDNDIKDKIIDNPMNLVTTCSLRCNDSMNIFYKPVERDSLIKKIIESL